jgi:hypothetical protein
VITFLPFSALVLWDRRATEKRNEFATLHSITSSALVSSAGGTVRPSALAVLSPNPVE